MAFVATRYCAALLADRSLRNLVTTLMLVAFALVSFVLANEAGLFTAPSLYSPAGGLSGRSTFAGVVWLTAWGILHARWADRHIAPAPVALWTAGRVRGGGDVPPVWGIF